MSEAKRSPMVEGQLAGASGELRSGGVTIPRSGSAVVAIDDHSLRLTHLDRVLWPETGFTKADLVAYYLTIADVMLPHLRDRPLTLGRFPGGVEGRGFAQMDIPGRPSWMRTIPLLLVKGDVREFPLVDDRGALAWLGQMGTLELHTFLGRADDLTTPTSIVFDLDPSEPAGLLEAARVALLLRERLASIGLRSFAKTSGSVGMHVFVPLNTPATYAETRAAAGVLADVLVAERPDLVTGAMARDARGGRVFVDVRQNAERLTMVVPYSLRSTPRPTASTPVSWDEVEHACAARRVRSLFFEAGDVVRRAAAGDPFAPVLSLHQALPRG